MKAFLNAGWEDAEIMTAEEGTGETDMVDVIRMIARHLLVTMTVVVEATIVPLAVMTIVMGTLMVEDAMMIVDDMTTGTVDRVLPRVNAGDTMMLRHVLVEQTVVRVEVDTVAGPMRERLIAIDQTFLK